MEATICPIHGPVGIGFACSHVVHNIHSHASQRCIEVSVRITDSIEATNAGVEPEIYNIPFCLQCFEDKRMSEAMKIPDDPRIAEIAIEDYNVKTACAQCIKEYVEHNRLN